MVCVTVYPYKGCVGITVNLKPLFDNRNYRCVMYTPFYITYVCAKNMRGLILAHTLIIDTSSIVTLNRSSIQYPIS